MWVIFWGAAISATAITPTRRRNGLHPDVTLSVRFYFGKTTINRTRYMSSDEIDSKTAR